MQESEEGDWWLDRPGMGEEGRPPPSGRGAPSSPSGEQGHGSDPRVQHTPAAVPSPSLGDQAPYALRQHDRPSDRPTLRPTLLGAGIAPRRRGSRSGKRPLRGLGFSTPCSPPGESGGQKVKISNAVPNLAAPESPGAGAAPGAPGDAAGRGASRAPLCSRDLGPAAQSPALTAAAG